MNNDNILGIKCISLGNGTGKWIHNPNNINIDNNPIYSNIKQIKIDKNYFIRIPKFYIKNDNHLEINISPNKLPDFHCHPAFLYKGQELDYFYIGKYSGSLFKNKLGSVPKAYPHAYATLEKNKLYCLLNNNSRNKGFMLTSIYQYAAIQILYMIEYANTDSQKTIGLGRCMEDDVALVDAPDVSTGSYRGIIGLWGNTWEWVDGIEIKDNRTYYLWDNQGYQEYQKTNTQCPGIRTWYYVKQWATEINDRYNFTDIFIPDTNQLTDMYNEGSYSDGIYGGASGTCRIGGVYSSGNLCGIFSLAFCGNPEYIANNISARLSKIDI